MSFFKSYIMLLKAWVRSPKRKVLSFQILLLVYIIFVNIDVEYVIQWKLIYEEQNVREIAC